MKNYIIIFLMLIAGAAAYYFLLVKNSGSNLAKELKKINPTADASKAMDYIKSVLSPDQLLAFKKYIIGFEREATTDPERAAMWSKGFTSDSANLKIPYDVAMYRQVVYNLYKYEGVVSKEVWDQVDTDLVFLYR
jgi:hypothetical protein